MAAIAGTGSFRRVLRALIEQRDTRAELQRLRAIEAAARQHVIEGERDTEIALRRALGMELPIWAKDLGER